MLSSIVTHQRFGDDLFTGFNPLVAQLGQLKWITLPGQDGINDSQAGLSRDVADHVVQLQIHLVQRFLHVVDVSRSHLYQTFPVPQQCTHGADFLLWPV